MGCVCVYMCVCVFYVLYFMFCVLCFMFYVLCFMLVTWNWVKSLSVGGWGGVVVDQTKYRVTPVLRLGAGALMLNAWDWTVTTKLFNTHPGHTINVDFFEL